MKKTLFALLLMLALLLTLPALAQEPAAEAQDITDLCTFTPSNAKSDLPKMRDGKYKTYWSSTKKGYLEISSPDDTPMYGLYINWAQYITSWSLQVPDENGGWTTIRAYEPDLFNTVYNEYLPLEGGYTRVRLLCQSPDDRHALHIAEIHVLGEGEVPSWVQQWKVFSGKADMVLLITDPGDEYIYFGGLLPYYAAQGKEIMLCVAVNTNSAYKCELLDGLWTVGIRNYPVMSSFVDQYADSLDYARTLYDEEEAVAWQVQQLRRFKPEVVVGHDVNGEYGHGVHMYNADTLMQALELSADPSYDPESAQEWGVWDVPKTYLHLWPENPIVMDWSQPLSAFGGKTAVEMARLGFAEHVSQQTFFKVEDYGPYDCRKFGLYRSLVGPDAQGGDFFENLAAEDYSDYLPPEPEPEPEPEPVSEPEPERTRTLPGWILLAGMVGAVALAEGMILYGRGRKR